MECLDRPATRFKVSKFKVSVSPGIKSARLRVPPRYLCHSGPSPTLPTYGVRFLSASSSRCAPHGPRQSHVQRPRPGCCPTSPISIWSPSSRHSGQVVSRYPRCSPIQTKPQSRAILGSLDSRSPSPHSTLQAPDPRVRQTRHDLPVRRSGDPLDLYFFPRSSASALWEYNVSIHNAARSSSSSMYAKLGPRHSPVIWTPRPRAYRARCRMRPHIVPPPCSVRYRFYGNCQHVVAGFTSIAAPCNAPAPSNCGSV
ncbi:hypothetical protein B0H11DRAFT_655802 [Mycena galericulata]|nr:hypothetical protein B0H11DRAFT_655802 [Mycena galericulata]